MGYFIENKGVGENYHYTAEVIRNPILVSMICNIHNSAKPCHGLQINDTRMGFPCPFHGVLIDSVYQSWLRRKRKPIHSS